MTSRADQSSDQLGARDASQSDEPGLASQARQWAEIMTLSEQLLQLAQQKNWSRLTQLHARRDTKIHDFFTQKIDKNLSEHIQTDIQKICQQDQQIVDLIADNRAQMAEQSQHLQKLKSRVQEYLSAGEEKN